MFDQQKQHDVNNVKNSRELTILEEIDYKQSQLLKL